VNATLEQRVRRLVPALWAGALLTVAAIATPAPFAMLPTADAGRVVARILAQEAWLSLAIGAAVVVMERRQARREAQAGQGSQLSTNLLLGLGAVACTLAGYFAVQPMLPAARAGQAWIGFGTLHAASVGFYALKLALVLTLAWRCTSR
jgi:Domain of unknown function (DUF4149)